jgi:hypothetical protein
MSSGLWRFVSITSNIHNSEEQFRDVALEWRNVAPPQLRCHKRKSTLALGPLGRVNGGPGRRASGVTSFNNNQSATRQIRSHMAGGLVLDGAYLPFGVLADATMTYFGAYA